MTRQLQSRRVLSVVVAVVLLSSATFSQAFLPPSLTTSVTQRATLLSTRNFSSAAPAVNGDRAAVTTTTNAASLKNGREEPSNHKKNVPDNSIRLNVYEKARTVTSVCTSGTLCTVSCYEGIEGAPFGSFVDYVLDDKGNPVLLMNDMSMHTMNIMAAQERNGGKPAMVSLFTQLGGAGSGAGPAATISLSGGRLQEEDKKLKGLQDVSRCSLTGTLEKIDPSSEDMPMIRMRYSLTHAYADQVMDSPKFSFYRLRPQKIYFVGGFGVLAKWVDPQEYQNAAPDILAKEAAAIVNRVNREHSEDLQLTARFLLNVQTELDFVRVTNVDRLGMDIRVTSQMGTRRNKLVTDEFRIGFRIPVISVEDAKSEILKIFQEAWEKGNGYSWEGEMPGENVPILKIAADSLE